MKLFTAVESKTLERRDPSPYKVDGDVDAILADVECSLVQITFVFGFGPVDHVIGALLKRVEQLLRLVIRHYDSDRNK